MKLPKRVSLAATGHVSLRSTKPTFCRVAKISFAAQKQRFRHAKGLLMLENQMLPASPLKQAGCPEKCKLALFLEEGQGGGVSKEFSWYHRVNKWDATVGYLWGRCCEEGAKMILYEAKTKYSS